jgi:hypothetical protein
MNPGRHQRGGEAVMGYKEGATERDPYKHNRDGCATFGFPHSRE